MIRRVFLLSLMSFLVSISIFMVWPVMSIYAYEYVGASKPEVGAITAAAFVTAFLIRVPFSLGIRGERLSAALIGGLAANSAALAGYGFSPDVPTLMAFRVLHGVAVALDYTLMLTLSSMIASDESEMTLSIESYTSALALGLVIGPALGSVLVPFIDLRFLMFISSILGLGALAVGILFLRDIHGIWLGFQVSRVGLRDIIGVLRSRGVVATSTTYLSFIIAYGAMVAYAPLKAKLDLGLTNQHVTLLFFGYFLTVFLVRLMLAKLRKVFGVVNLLYIALTSSALGIFLIGLAPHLPVFAAGFIMTGFTHGLIFPLAASVAARTTPPDVRITGNAAFLSSFDLGNLIGPMIAGLLVAETTISITLMLMTVSPLLGLIAASSIRRLGIP